MSVSFDRLRAKRASRSAVFEHGRSKSQHLPEASFRERAEQRVA